MDVSVLDGPKWRGPRCPAHRVWGLSKSIDHAVKYFRWDGGLHGDLFEGAPGFGVKEWAGIPKHEKQY